MSDTSLIVKLGFENSTANKQLKELTNELKSLDKQIKNIDTSTKSFDNNMNNMGQKIDLCKTKITGLNDKIEIYSKQLKDAEQRLKTAESEMQKLGERTQENAKGWDSANKELQNAQSHYNNINRKLTETQSDLKKTTTELAKMQSEMAKMPFDNLVNKLNGIGDKLHTLSSATAPLSIALGGLFTGAIKTTIDFEQAIAEVGAISGATAEELQLLSDKARSIGENTQLSATQGAEALKLLMQAGYDTNKAIATVDSTVNLSIASSMDLAEATSIVVSVMSAYGLEAEKSSRITDILAKTASNSNTNVSELGEAFKNVAPTASALGYSVEDTALVLGVMANQAIQGGEAGNALKSILASLVKPTEKASSIMKEYGISLTDTSGQALPLREVIGQLRDKFGDLDEVQQAEIATTLVGKQQMSKFLAIINGGDKDFNKLTEAIDNCDGATEEMRKTMENTTQGSIKSMLSKLQEMGIQIGEKLLPHIVKLVEKISDAITWFNNLDSSTQDLIISFGLALASISPLSGALGTLFDGMGSGAKIIGGLVEKLTLKQGLAGALETTATTATVSTATIASGFGTLATAIAPFLVGGTIVVGLGMAVAGLVTGYKNWQESLKQTTEEYDYGTELMTKANGLLAKDVEVKYREIQGNMDTFRSDGVEKLVLAFADLKDGVEPDLTSFAEICKSKIEEAKINIHKQAKDLTDGLSFLNTDIATIFSASELAKIQENWTGELVGGLEESYTQLMETINNKDEIIASLMEEHGYTYEGAYQEWENRVLEQYNIFCDDLIKAQTGYQEESLGSLEEFLQQQSIKDKESYDASIKAIQDGGRAKADEYERQYDTCLIAIQKGETQINDIQFESAEQAMKYADLVLEYKLANNEIEKQQEIETASRIAYEKGIITRQDYLDTVKACEDKIAILQGESDAMAKIMELCSENVSGSWEGIWEAIQTAEEKGIPQSITRNEEFINSIVEYFNNGGTDMSEAMKQAYDNIVGTTDESLTMMEEDIESWAKVNESSINNVIEWMNKQNVSLDEACEKFNVDSELMKEYLRLVAEESGLSTQEIIDDLLNTQEEYDNTSESAENYSDATDMTSNDSQQNVENSTNEIQEDLKNTQEEYDNTSKSAENYNETTNKSANGAKSSINLMEEGISGSLGKVDSKLAGTGKNSTDFYGTIKSNTNNSSSSFSNMANNIGNSLSKTNINLGTTGIKSTDFYGTMKSNANNSSTSFSGMATNIGNSLSKTNSNMSKTGSNATTMGTNINKGTNNGANSGESMASRLTNALLKTTSIFANTASNVTINTNTMKSNINSIQGKTVSVIVNFLSNGFQSLKNNITSIVNSAKNALGLGKDSFVSAYNFGDNYESDSIYGMKDSGMKTISLSDLANDSISAYATKDATASGYVEQAVSNYNYNTNPSSAIGIGTGSNQILSMINKLLTDSQQPNIIIDIHDNSVRNDEDLKKLANEIIKEIDFNTRIRNKRF